MIAAGQLCSQVSGFRPALGHALPQCCSRMLQPCLPHFALQSQQLVGHTLLRLAHRKLAVSAAIAREQQFQQRLRHAPGHAGYTARCIQAGEIQ